MELKPGLSALVTGCASGIGKALCLALAKKGIFVTVVDLSEEKGREVARLVEKENRIFHPDRNSPSSLFIKCDVTSARIDEVFDKHLETFGGLDICINNAGIASRVPFQNDETDGKYSWRHVIDVNLIAVVNCTRLAIRAMRSMKKRGAIINIASAAGLYPSINDPIYSASKGGVVMFTRSLASLKRDGIWINALCPEFVQTDMGLSVSPKLVDLVGGFVPMEMIVNGAFELIKDERKAGSCLWITNRRGMEYWPTSDEEEKFRVRPSKSKGRYSYILPSKLQKPDAFEKIIVHTLGHNFRTATKIVRADLRSTYLKSDHVLIKIVYAGVNASDVNFSSGRYFTGKSPPLDAGFEGVGLIVETGESVDHLSVGAPVAVMAFGCYAEFLIVPSRLVIPVSRPDPEVLAMLTSGLTASIALETAGRMVSGENVLVTAAAGGTGQFAVQLAKLAGNNVIATCGGEKKAALLKSLGADRVIDYKKEDIKSVLKKDFPEGVNVIYESVGGDMFNLCLNALATYGRLVVIGMVSQYQGEDGWKPLNYPGLCEKILTKSQTVAGFFLPHYAHLYKEHLGRLFDLYSSGRLKVAVDPKTFLGLSAVADAVEYLHSGESLGKVVVCIDPKFAQPSAKL